MAPQLTAEHFKKATKERTAYLSKALTAAATGGGGWGGCGGRAAAPGDREGRSPWGPGGPAGWPPMTAPWLPSYTWSLQTRPHLDGPASSRGQGPAAPSPRGPGEQGAKPVRPGRAPEGPGSAEEGWGAGGGWPGCGLRGRGRPVTRGRAACSLCTCQQGERTAPRHPDAAHPIHGTLEPGPTPHRSMALGAPGTLPYEDLRENGPQPGDKVLQFLTMDSQAPGQMVS